jgi:hypothetical protein
MIFQDLPPQPASIADSVPAISLHVAQRAQAAVICARAHGATVDKLAVFDTAKPSSQRRFWLLDLRGPAPVVVLSEWVAHGAGSDPNRDGRAETFSDTPNSLMTSLGLYRVAEPYHGKSGRLSWHLDGLTPGYNANARARAVVMHAADYVAPGHVGRSHGCPALRPEAAQRLAQLGMANTYLWIDSEGQGLERTATLSCAQAKHWLVGQQQRRSRAQAIAMTWNLETRPSSGPVCVRKS